MILFDTHAHYDDRRFDKDRDALLASMPEQGVGYICNIGCDMPTSHQSVALAEAHAHVYAVVGIHPHNAAEATEEQVQGDLPAPVTVLVLDLGVFFLVFLHIHYRLPPNAGM
jgi:TatD DNase family protein